MAERKKNMFYGKMFFDDDFSVTHRLVPNEIEKILPWIRQLAQEASEVPIENWQPYFEGRKNPPGKKEIEVQTRDVFVPKLIAELDTYPETGGPDAFPELQWDLDLAFAFSLAILAPGFPHTLLALAHLQHYERMQMQIASRLALLYAGVAPEEIQPAGLLSLLNERLYRFIPARMYVRIAPGLSEYVAGNPELINAFERLIGQRYEPFSIETALMLAQAGVTSLSVISCLTRWVGYGGERFRSPKTYDRYTDATSDRCTRLLINLLATNEEALAQFLRSLTDITFIDSQDIIDHHRRLTVLKMIDPSKVTLPGVIDSIDNLYRSNTQLRDNLYLRSVVEIITHFTNAVRHKAKGENILFKRLTSQSDNIVLETLQGIRQLVYPGEAIIAAVIGYTSQQTEVKNKQVCCTAIETLGNWEFAFPREKVLQALDGAIMRGDPDVRSVAETAKTKLNELLIQ